MKAYSFYFNANDWLGSQSVKLMSKAERGVYIHLLATAWGSKQPGTLPASEDQVRRLAECTTVEWAEYGPSILAMFPLSECQTYRYNERLLQEVEKERVKSERAAKSANARWKSGNDAFASQNDANASNKDANAMPPQCASNAQEQEQVKDNNTPDAEPAAPSPADRASSLPPVEPCHLTAQVGGKPLTKKPADHGPAFDEFWQAYGKKEDKKKASKAWAGLTADQRTAALAGLPAYVAATPDKRYRKNPLTWLNGECWQDEDTPAGRQVVAATPQPAPMLVPPAAPPAPNLEFLAQQAAAEAARQAAHFARFSKPQPCSQPLSQPQA